MTTSLFDTGSIYLRSSRTDWPRPIEYTTPLTLSSQSSLISTSITENAWQKKHAKPVTPPLPPLCRRTHQRVTKLLLSSSCHGGKSSTHAHGWIRKLKKGEKAVLGDKANRCLSSGVSDVKGRTKSNDQVNILILCNTSRDLPKSNDQEVEMRT